MFVLIEIKSLLVAEAAADPRVAGESHGQVTMVLHDLSQRDEVGRNFLQIGDLHPGRLVEDELVGQAMLGRNKNGR